MHEDCVMVLRGCGWFDQTYTPPHNPDFDCTTLHPVVRIPFSQLFATMTMVPNDDIMPCTCVEDMAYSPGDLFKNSLGEVWNGPGFARSRAFITYCPPGRAVCETLGCMFL